MRVQYPIQAYSPYCEVDKILEWCIVSQIKILSKYLSLNNIVISLLQKPYLTQWDFKIRIPLSYSLRVLLPQALYLHVPISL